MAKVKLAGEETNTKGDLPKNGTKLPPIKLTKNNLSDASLDDFKGKKIVMNIFPSLDTSVCATSVRKFNTIANEMDNTIILSISKDLPFAMERFCSTEGLSNVIPLSAFRSPEFGEVYGVEIVDGPLKGLLARSIVVADENGDIIYEELVPEITSEPNYAAILEIINK
ncbi:MAG: thiol peroxidase [Bacteroidales bacterium]|nr:thiol peroxidase [Bacteroidales bacterium]